MPLGMIAAFALAAELGDFSKDSDLRALMSLPRDVRVHLDRRMGCNHWLGEEPYDKERARQINAAVRELRCASLDREEPLLRKRYGASPPVLKALDDYRDTLW
jgi:hypothetical protein